MLKAKSTNPLKCKTYYNIKQLHEFNADNLNHMKTYNHFSDNYEQKPKCRYGDECKYYQRSEENLDDNNVEDECHMLIFRHPPRTRQIKL